MNRFAPFMVIYCFIFVAVCQAAPSFKINWDDLKPVISAQDDPMSDLSDEELEFVEWIMYLRATLPAEVDIVNQELYDEVNTALPKLKEKGLDVDVLIEQRKIRATMVNNKLDGQQVELSGYLLPLDFSGKSVSEFLLVPYIGACIHTPPPPPNQIVHAVSKTPTPYSSDDFFRPVSVFGKMKVQSLSKNLFLVDGKSDIDIGYSISVEKIENFTP